MNKVNQDEQAVKQVADVIWPSGRSYLSSRAPAWARQAVKVAIDDREHGGLLQTRWLEARVHNGPGAPSLETGSWHRSYKKYGAEFGRFIKLHSGESFRMALVKELQDG